ncbi:ribonuclease HII [Clostridium aestuarii]|uniref:Ribonuclease HII n=1 Tax=Clostridium aestuarii TaxID=338193 RepID=A0ABT4CY98_9CLOT|nr:ribonuclease HII [Clostridium aestuarii]MCY6483966.1 ribonuclease HII [Clostridium aestuarii]
MKEIDFTKMTSTEVKNYVKVQLENHGCDYNSLLNLINKDERKTVQKLHETVEKFILKKDMEINRTKKMYGFDKTFQVQSYIAGTDEVGRGPLAGPIVAAAVILDLNYKTNEDLILKINDSKKLTLKTREELNKIIKHNAISYCIVEIDNNEIDSKGIAWCNNEVLKKACEGLKVEPELVLSDGYAIKKCKYDNKFVIKGDCKSASIACASIIAKVYRDNLMKEYAKTYPQYAFDKNVGYGTKEHIDAIKKYGPTPIHRMTFLKNILTMF